MKYGKRIIILMLAAVMLLMCAACSSKTPAEPQTEPAKASGNEPSANAKKTDYATETLALEGDLDYGAPQPFTHGVQGPANLRCDLIFDSLMTAGQKDMIPWLAESYELADDNVTYTFVLHEDALWHDGEPVTTEDVAFSIDYYSKFPDGNVSLGTADDPVIASYKIIDEHTIEIVAAKVSYNSLASIGSFDIIPKHVWENVADPYNYTEPDAFIGCGMYKYVDYDGASNFYSYEAFEDYYGFQPGAKYLQFVPVSDVVLAFENGDIDIAPLPGDLHDEYVKRSDVSIYTMDDFLGYKLIFNYNNVPELLDYDARAALYQALDREAMVEAIYRGQGHVASAGQIPASVNGYTDEVKAYPYDIKGAKAILEPLNLSFKLIANNEKTGTNEAMAELIKLQLAEAGVDVTVEMYDTMVKNDMCSNGDFDVALSYHGGWNGDPVSNIVSAFSDTERQNPSTRSLSCSTGYTNEALTKEADALLTIMDTDERIEALKQVQIDASNDLQILPLVTQVTTYVYHEEVFNGWRATYSGAKPLNNRISYSSQFES